MNSTEASKIHQDTMKYWGGHRPGTDSFTRMALIAFNRIQHVHYGNTLLPTQEDLDSAHAELRLLERINEDAHRRRIRP